MTTKFEGPLPACRAIDSLMCDLGAGLAVLIDSSSLSDKEKVEFRQSMENILVGVFAGEKVFAIRSYIYDLYRGQEAKS